MQDIILSPIKTADLVAELVAQLRPCLNELLTGQKQPEDQRMDIDQLRQFLPGNPSRITIYRKTGKGEIPHHKAPGGRELYFLKSEIDEWLKNGNSKKTKKYLHTH